MEIYSKIISQLGLAAVEKMLINLWYLKKSLHRSQSHLYKYRSSTDLPVVSKKKRKKRNELARARKRGGDEETSSARPGPSGRPSVWLESEPSRDSVFLSWKPNWAPANRVRSSVTKSSGPWLCPSSLYISQSDGLLRIPLSRGYPFFFFFVSKREVRKLALIMMQSRQRLDSVNFRFDSMLLLCGLRMICDSFDVSIGVYDEMCEFHSSFETTGFDINI